MNRKFMVPALASLLITGMLSGCNVQKEADASASLPPATILIAGSWEDCRAIETVGREFTAKYPTCTIEYEYLQDYYASLEKRMSGDNAVDIFFTTNIQEGTPMLPYALDLNSCEGLDFSKTFAGLKDNFAYRENGAISDKLYAIPLGAEMRGLYVNKTLLDSLGIPVPTNRQTLLDACKKLTDNGYIPMQGNPGDFAQSLMYPWICNDIANADNYEELYAKINSRDFKPSDTFKEQFEFMYSLIETGYYDYKKAQTDLNLFTDNTDLDYARYLLNVVPDGDGWKKGEGVGQVAFMPSPMSLQSVIDRTKDDYHVDIEYLFIPAPVGEDGGYAYMSPAHGIAVNKDAPHLEQSIRFMDFLFTKENNELFAKEFNIIPNTEGAFDYIKSLYDIPENRISQLGQVTFDYGFYDIISVQLRDLSKGNNPKYMQENSDGTVSLYPLEHYLDILEESFKENGEG